MILRKSIMKNERCKSICLRNPSVELIGPQFVYAVKPSLKEHWTDEIEESWLQLFRYISYIISYMMETYTSQDIPVDNKT
ncbi:hypothetical protein CDAR_601561 [Caerostris darwini]|uniref:Uncharacterized protein n=1 Tax=Caerostris darwini TaxID=1538125 RepID=A0AAV4N0H1_9ARAC|nr:hypothetical protein CDAR_601561 [Caerostris darwini]